MRTLRLSLRPNQGTSYGWGYVDFIMENFDKSKEQAAVVAARANVRNNVVDAVA